MFSNDRNIETIGQLAEALKHYIGLQREYVKLDVIDKMVRLIKAIALAITFFLIIVAVVLFFSLAISFWLSLYVGIIKAFLIMGIIHVLIFVLLLIFRRPLIERPLVHFLAELLLSK